MNSIYRYIADRMDDNPALCRAALVVRFEDLCRDPYRMLRVLLDHAELGGCDAIVQRYSKAIRFPTYYRHSFTAGELDIIEHETSDTARRYGYDWVNA